MFYADGHRMAAHRVMWSIENDKFIPDGLFVLHRCPNPACCHPDHLYLARRVFTPGKPTRFEEMPEWALYRYKAQQKKIGL